MSRFPVNSRQPDAPDYYRLFRRALQHLLPVTWRGHPELRLVRAPKRSVVGASRQIGKLHQRDLFVQQELVNV